MAWQEFLPVGTVVIVAIVVIALDLPRAPGMRQPASRRRSSSILRRLKPINLIQLFPPKIGL